MGGHSYGELVALHAAGVAERAGAGRALGGPRPLDARSRRRRRRRDGGPPGRPRRGRAAHPRSSRRAGRQLERSQADGDRRADRGGEAGARPGRGPRNSGRLLPVSCAFHTPLVAAAREPLAGSHANCSLSPPDRPVYSNLDAAPHPADPAAIAARLGDHLASPVRFADMIEAMHRDGARVFVEVGPGSILTPLVEPILVDRPHLAVACDAPGSSGLAGWLRAVARLVVAGLPLRLERLTRGRVAARARSCSILPLDEDAEPTDALDLARQRQSRPADRRSRAEPAGPGTARPSPAAPNSRSPASPNGLTAAHGVANGLASSPSPSFACRSGRRANQRSPCGAIHARCRDETAIGIRIAYHETVISAPSKSADRVIESFQQTMQAFLEVQKSTMLAYLAGRGATEIARAAGLPDGARSTDRETSLPGSPATSSPARSEAAANCRSSGSASARIKR